jgi:four helix bundle protein
MGGVKSFEDLEIWQQAREISHEIYECSIHSDLRRDFVLRDQMSRSSGSIMDNIAEGFERNGNKEFKPYLSIAKASSGELRSQIHRAFDRKYLDVPEYKRLTDKLQLLNRRISAFILYLDKSNYKGSKYKH